MLTNTQITETEAVFVALDSGDMTDNLVFEIREHVYYKSFEQHCYLQWLLDRWTILRKHAHHLPTRAVNMDTYVPETKRRHSRNKKSLVG